MNRLFIIIILLISGCSASVSETKMLLTTGNQLSIPEMTIERVEELKEDFKNKPWVYYHSAKFYQKIDSLKLAKADILKGLTLDNSNVAFIILAANIDMKLGLFKEAEEHATDALRHGVVTPEILYIKAQLEFENRDIFKSLKWINKAIDLEKKADYYALKAQILLKVDSTASMRNFSEALKINPKYIPAVKFYYSYFSKSKNLDTLLYWANRLYEIDSSNVDYIKKLVDVYVEKEDYESAIRKQRKIIKIDPKSLQTNKAMASLFLKQRRYDSLNYYLDECRRIAPLDSAFLLFEAKTSVAKGQLSKARRQYAEILKTYPDNEIVKQNLQKLNRKIAYLQSIERTVKETDLEFKEKTATPF